MSKATAIQLATASAEFTIIDTVADPEVSNGRACIEVGCASFPENFSPGHGMFWFFLKCCF